MTPCPKPARREKPVKHSSLKRTTRLKPSGATKAKKVVRQKAFYASAAWKKLRREALERAKHQCQYWSESRATTVTVGHLRYAHQAWEGRDIILTPCAETTGLHVHHKTNARFGGDELPEDLQVLCKRHHDLVEARDHPTRKRR